jgi:proline iminopeptidase
VDHARAEGNDEALEQLAAVQPPYRSTKELMVQRKWLGHYGGDFYAGGGMSRLVRAVLLSPEYSVRDVISFYACVMNSLDRTWGDIANVDFIRDAPRLEVPVYFFTGRHDYNTPFELVERYFEVLEVPYKEIVWFEHSAHMLNLEEPERYQEVLIHEILPATYPGS